MDKLGQSILKLNPEEVPPLAYQMLRLTRDHSSVVLLKTLAAFFDTRLDISDNIESEDLISQYSSHGLLYSIAELVIKL